MKFANGVEFYDTSKMYFIALVIYKEKRFHDDIERFYRKSYYYTDRENKIFEITEVGVENWKFLWFMRFEKFINFIFDYENFFPPEEISFTNMISTLVMGGEDVIGDVIGLINKLTKMKIIKEN